MSEKNGNREEQVPGKLVLPNIYFTNLITR